MASICKVILLGNLGNDPEVRYMPNGGAVANLSVATSQRWKDKQTGETKEKTEWTRVVMYNRIAEIAGEYLKKGSSVYLEGRLETRKWTDKDGIDRYTTEVIADQMQLLGGRGESQDQQRNPQQSNHQPSQQRQAQRPPAGGGGVADLDSDIPFGQAPFNYSV